MCERKTTQLNFHRTKRTIGRSNGNGKRSGRCCRGNAGGNEAERHGYCTIKLPIFLFLCGSGWPAAAALRFSWSNKSRENKTRRLVGEMMIGLSGARRNEDCRRSGWWHHSSP